jgi:hypothetical protein
MMRAMKHTTPHAVLCGLALSALAGCAGPCKQIAAERDAFRSAVTTEQSSGPHLRLVVPGQVVEKAWTAALRELPTTRAEIPGLGRVAEYAPKLDITPRSVRLVADKDDALRIGVDFDVKDGGRTLFGLQMEGEAPIQLRPEKGELEVVLRADALKKVTPRLGDGASDALTDALWSRIPSLVQRMVPRSQVRRLADEGVKALAERSYDLLRARVLSKLGEVTRFKAKIPDVPISALALEMTEKRSLVVEARTTLAAPALGGLRERNTPHLSMSLPAVAGLANYAMGKGTIPSRYTREGKADAAGTYEPGLAWQSGQRPLKVNVWNTSGICVGARVGATPQVSLTKNAKGKQTVKLEVSDGTVEDIQGPPFFELGAWAVTPWLDAFELSQEVATGTELAVSGKGWKVGVESLKLTGDHLEVDLDIGVPADGS